MLRRFVHLVPLFVLLSVSTAHATGFAPTDLAGLQLWLDASQGVTTDGTTPAVDGDLVAQWNDQSGNARNATQSSGANKPTFKTNIFTGRPVLRFTGSHYLTTTSFLTSSYNTALTFFIVANKSTTGLQVATSNQGAVWYTGRSNSLVYYESALTPSEKRLVGSDLDRSVETFRYNGAQKTLRRNGAGGSVAATGNLGLNGALTIGRLSSGGFRYNGDIAEIILFQRALTDPEVAAVEQYLREKYGIASAPASQLIFDGDSMTAGVGSSGANGPYPLQALTLLGGSGAWNYGIFAVSGQTVADMTGDAAQQVDTTYRSDAALNVVALLGGTNDLFLGANATTTYNRIVAYAHRDSRSRVDRVGRWLSDAEATRSLVLNACAASQLRADSLRSDPFSHLGEEPCRLPVPTNSVIRSL